MTSLSEPNDWPQNPIYCHLIDYDLIDQVARRAEALEDPRVEAGQAELSAIHQRVRERYLRALPAAGTADGARLVAEWRQLSSQQLVTFSQQVFEDVCAFVLSAMTLYRIIRSYRTLTEDERDQGEKLRQLLMSLQEFVPPRAHE